MADQTTDRIPTQSSFQLCCYERTEENDNDSQKRKEVSKLISHYKKEISNVELLFKNQSDQLFDTLQVMLRIYTSDDKHSQVSLLKKCRLNPNYEQIQRNDLQYYTPQLINFMVFHENMSNLQMLKFIRRASESDFFFAHLVYFQLKSVSEIVHPKGSIQMKAVQLFLKQFQQEMALIYADTLLIATQLQEEYMDKDRARSATYDILAQNKKVPKVDQNQSNETIKQSVNKGLIYKTDTINEDQPHLNEYGTNYYSGSEDYFVSSDQIQLKNYRTIFGNDKQQSQEAEDELQQERGFLSTIDFWQDLTIISEKLHLANPKIISLRADLQQINRNLPSAVYVPFVKDSMRNFVILNIVSSESRVFSTKTRSPFSLCLELYRPEEELLGAIVEARYEETKQSPRRPTRMSEAHLSHLDQTLSNPKTLQMLKLIKYKSNKEKQYRSLSFDENPKQDSRQDQRATNRQKLSFSHTKNNYEYTIMKDLLQVREQILPEEQFQGDIPTQKDQKDQKGIAIFYNKQSGSKINEEQIYQSQLTESINHDQHDRSASQTNLEIIMEYSKQSEQELFQSEIKISEQEYIDMTEQIFGEASSTQATRIRQNSPFKKLQSWKLINIIVKTDDNLKQEQFALQLISQFEQIFIEEGLPLKLTYYEVLSLGPACGVIEMDATTIDSLKKTLFNNYRELHNFSMFFKAYFRDDYNRALSNYLNSLVAYCLVTYFLQVKDRHNGNILLLRDGSLMHIDFGFFLSNAPGGRLQFESKVPFKLLNEYIEVLGGVESKSFEQFRRMFYKGFQVCQKHQDKILILVKMMYSGHGTTLPCFKKGELAIREMEARFNPPLKSDADLYVFTQQLINASLENWRTRWYDKYQYYVQGIFY